MRVLAITAGVLGIAAALGASPAGAQQVKKSTLKGVIQSAGVDVPDTGSAAALTTPTEGFFILTQVCVEDPRKVIVTGSSFGTIVLGRDECTTYTPGIALPQNETITFTDDGGGAQQAMLTGVLSRK